ncbi:MAG TPA: arginine deiminase family protein [Candidatus Limnocylindria bacterium]|nr:arginine deiminase family protein [Candidatus Limnocylindria bacterium]
MRSEEVHDIDFLDEVEAVWGGPWGAQSKIGKLRRALVCRPTENDAPPEARADPISYGFLDGMPDLAQMQAEHDAFTRVLQEEGVTVEFVEVEEHQVGAYMRLRSLWATASAFVINGGAIIPRYGRGPWRRGQEVLLARKLMELGCPILLTVHGKGVAELGGNALWLDPEHIIVGLGSSGNIEGLRQVEPLLRTAGAREIHVAYFTGIAHLDLVLGIAGPKLAVMHRPHLDHETIRYLRHKGFTLIETDQAEFRRGACNLLALDERTVVLPSGCDRTAEALDRHGVRVIELDFTAINLAGGGPHCAVGALLRDPGPSLTA